MKAIGSTGPSYEDRFIVVEEKGIPEDKTAEFFAVWSKVEESNGRKPEGTPEERAEEDKKQTGSYLYAYYPYMDDQGLHYAGARLEPGKTLGIMGYADES